MKPFIGPFNLLSLTRHPLPRPSEAAGARPRTCRRHHLPRGGGEQPPDDDGSACHLRRRRGHAEKPELEESREHHLQRKEGGDQGGRRVLVGPGQRGVAGGRGEHDRVEQAPAGAGRHVPRGRVQLADGHYQRHRHPAQRITETGHRGRRVGGGQGEDVLLRELKERARDALDEEQRIAQQEPVPRRLRRRGIAAGRPATDHRIDGAGCDCRHPRGFDETRSRVEAERLNAQRGRQQQRERRLRCVDQRCVDGRDVLQRDVQEHLADVHAQHTHQHKPANVLNAGPNELAARRAAG
eukprot:scaffold25843_cov112-Isochrysis_galbana.AAC.1